MRLDKFLKVSRIIKRRSVANEVCDMGRVSVNGKPAKPSAEVKVGDILELTMGQKAMRVRILSVQEFAKKEDADSMYEAV